MPLNMIARLGSSPMTIGKTNVAPNIATTCWAPRPAVLPQLEPLVRRDRLAGRGIDYVPLEHRHVSTLSVSGQAPSSCST